MACKQSSNNQLYNADQKHPIYILIDNAAAKGPAIELVDLLSQAIDGDLTIVEETPDVSNYIQLKISEEAKAVDPLKPGTVKYEMQEEGLLIEGSDSTHLYYAIYDFLERELGYRWLDAETDFIPQLMEIQLPKDLAYTYSPPIATRTVHARVVYDNPIFARKLKVTTSAFPYYAPNARVHTFHRFMPREHFLKDHPEYYALRNGRRISTQLCLTNADVLGIVVDSVQAHFNRHPEARVVSVSSDDNTQYCTCPTCTKSDQEYGGPTGTMINFVNQVAAKFPDKFISTLAYQYTRKPGEVKPANNVLITLCSIECDRSGSIEDKCQPFAEDMKGWNQQDATLRIWDYTTQFTNFLAPFPNLRTLQPNIQFFRDQGAKWVFEQHSNHPSDLYDLRVYLMAKLLWNPDLNVDSVITDFSVHYYGSAAEPIGAYVQSIHDAIAADPDYFLFLYGDPSQAFNSFLSAEKLEEYHDYFNKAETALAGDLMLLNRVRRARIGLDYATLEACRKNIAPAFTLLAENGQLNPSFQAALDRFKSTCQQNNITLMNEMGYTVEEYLAGWQTTITRATQSNIAQGATITLLTKPKKYANEDPQTLTDGAFGGASFYANWLGFEGNHLEAELDLGSEQEISFTGMAFLQVVNHLVFLPAEVTYSYAGKNKQFRHLGTIKNPKPLLEGSKINDIEYFDLSFDPVKARYLKVEAKNLLTPPDWHHGAGLPSWIFADEWVVR
ncbi:MAG: carbohydrate-binding protein [Saprospiraceae bacterium]|nr:MAG: carbohydrate-binding protein [Saprospiraceae bacterium]